MARRLKADLAHCAVVKNRVGKTKDYGQVLSRITPWGKATVELSGPLISI